MFNSNSRLYIFLLLLSVLAMACQGPIVKPSPTSIEGLTIRSDIVVVGKVLQNQSRWEKGHIITTSNVQPLQTLKGETGGKNIKVSFLGGTLGNINEHVEHQPILQEGEISVLFLSQDIKPGDKATPDFRIIADNGSITLVQPWERESRLLNNRRLIRQLESISTRVQKAGGAK